MGFFKVCDNHWRALTIVDKERLVADLAATFPPITLEKLCGGLTVQQTVILKFNDLPGELRGRLLLSVTDDGFLSPSTTALKAL